ncbi:LuxR C-terminal-related transcriptional regulator [Glaesserella parasuis]|nr:LuxR C-terminal-related transcriptional regulator [Glaesserella parasuis]AGO16703.1 transcriptional regulatory protein UhpA [Glaesserella parasuis ZJ0906]AIK17504.1 hypothetical protein JL26_06695 [Glaesserella parasuis]AIK90009.1 hypothetical protein JT17_04230 [Glaesserella parasuis]AWY46110.1 DNA-binding response regulator [Glaesserella parasuis 29755]EQA95074.1 transcriptional regulatory protein uhpA [Glaesserella parasuis 29755]
MIHVVLIDDHVIVRSGFSQLLSLESDVTVIGEFSSAKEARQHLPYLKPHVCIIDISMPELTTKLVSSKQSNPVGQLTKREREICELLILGFEPKEIGEKLNLSFKTVHVHRSNAINKLNVKNNVELANLLNSQLK